MRTVELNPGLGGQLFQHFFHQNRRLHFPLRGGLRGRTLTLTGAVFKEDAGDNNDSCHRYAERDNQILT